MKTFRFLTNSGPPFELFVLTPHRLRKSTYAHWLAAQRACVISPLFRPMINFWELRNTSNVCAVNIRTVYEDLNNTLCQFVKLIALILYTANKLTIDHRISLFSPPCSLFIFASDDSLKILADFLCRRHFLIETNIWPHIVQFAMKINVISTSKFCF